HAALLRSPAGGPGADGSHSRHRADLGARRPHVAPRRKADERRGTLFRAQYTLISPGGGPAFVENGNQLVAVRDAFPELVIPFAAADPRQPDVEPKWASRPGIERRAPGPPGGPRARRAAAHPGRATWPGAPPA